jgi:hypothetical protein
MYMFCTVTALRANVSYWTAVRAHVLYCDSGMCTCCEL